MKVRESIRENGQSIILVLLMFFGLVAMLALVLDGGNMYTQRRAAQLAADAGALAGARHLCGESPNHSAAESAAVLYAVTENNATSATVSFPEIGIIEVTANMQFLPFFAQVLGFNELNASATAAAGCDTPSAGNVMPIVWYCPDPPDEDAEPSEEGVCGYKYLDCDPDDAGCELPLYVFMDSIDMECVYPPNSKGTDDYLSGDVDCDWNDDGLDDALLGTSSRGWLDLIDGANASVSELDQQIFDACVNGIGTNLTDHTWVGRQPGVGSNFQAVRDYCEDVEVIIPIFDVPCQNTTDPLNDCDLGHDDDYITRVGASDYYHIAGFASFTITCVHASASDKGDKIHFEGGGWVWGSRCDGRNDLQLQNPGIEFTPGSYYTIEGYLNAEISPDVSGLGGVDSGTYVIYLIE